MLGPKGAVAWCAQMRVRRARAETGLDIGHVGEDQQCIGFELPGQQCGTQILVDDRLGPAQPAIATVGPPGCRRRRRR